MYRFGILVFLTGEGTTGLGKCGPLSHLESLFDSHIFLSFNSFCYVIWSLILCTFSDFAKLILKSLTKGHQPAHRFDYHLCKIFFFPVLGCQNMGD